MKIGIVGYGHLGQYLADRILNDENRGLQLIFVWNRTVEHVAKNIASNLILTDINNFTKHEVDLIVEVAHPEVTKQYGSRFLQHANLMLGSPTVLADADIWNSLVLSKSKHGLFIPVGALWGAQDIRNMNQRNSLESVTISMAKHPDSLKLTGSLQDKLQNVTKRSVLYTGPVRELCRLAPNNVNTMAVASIAASNLGFDGVIGQLIADASLKDCHMIEIEVKGKKDATGNQFICTTSRKNPAVVGNVTGMETFNTFYTSLLNTRGKGHGLHLC